MPSLIELLRFRGVGGEVLFHIAQRYNLVYLKHQESILTTPFTLTNPLPSSLSWPEEERGSRSL